MSENCSLAGQFAITSPPIPLHQTHFSPMGGWWGIRKYEVWLFWTPPSTHHPPPYTSKRLHQDFSFKLSSSSHSTSCPPWKNTTQTTSDWFRPFNSLFYIYTQYLAFWLLSFNPTLRLAPLHVSIIWPLAVLCAVTHRVRLGLPTLHKTGRPFFQLLYLEKLQRKTGHP